ncbi:lysine--tRNA ligase [Alphaproteobacteria bacterium endosymbiont of Tiliacea citrago]|uniref:lysine--tRNA ligase n=1 Tax=Alphaproteobacteria bacterium endosymbiont of Tiliacea citrago TaxID=3077944 RepID=UPI00313F0B1E
MSNKDIDGIIEEEIFDEVKDSEYKKNRLSKLEEWKTLQEKYPDSFNKKQSLEEALKLEEGASEISIAGRIMLMRSIGKICFIKLQDFSGFMQIVLHAEDLSNYDFYLKNLDLGDIVGVEGTIFFTRSGEKSIRVTNICLLTKCLHSLPEKWHGLSDDETKIRQRYLDLIMNEKSKEKFKFRYRFISKLKEFLNANDYIEVETPILQKQASGALATPFQTHHKALNIPLYLRIAPETYLKRLMAGGYERVYEIGKCFRNEGIDTTHLQEFTMLEFYTAYWNYEDLMKFILNLFSFLMKELSILDTITYEGTKINIGQPWTRMTYSELFKKYTNLDLEELLKDESKLYEELGKLEGIDVNQYKSSASLIDGVYKKYCRPKLIDPVIITHQPAVLGPLAKQNIDNPLFSDRFQVVINGLEVVNAYSELVDPELQRSILEKQKELKSNGEEEAMESEEDFLLAMEYAMPPMAGVGIGIDRVIGLLTDSSNLREIVFFPNVK